MRPADRRIVRLTPDTMEEYDRFVHAHPAALLYHSLRHMRLIAALTDAEQETLMAYDDDGALCGVLPLLARSGSLGRIYNSLPYYGSHGGVLSRDETASNALLAEYNRIVQQPTSAGATLIANPFTEQTGDMVPVHTLTDSRIGQFSPIAFESNHADALMHSFHHKTRNMVRKAQKQGFDVRVENQMLEFLRDVHQENMASMKGRAKSDAFFERVARIFRAGDDYRLWVARLSGEPVAALLLFYYRQTVEYYMPVAREQFRDRQPLSLLIFEAMAEASQRGYTMWNWGGTWDTQVGLHLFKSRWGTRDMRYTYYVHVNDDRVYQSTRARLLDEYPDFFVVPFSLLKTAS